MKINRFLPFLVVLLLACSSTPGTDEVPVNVTPKESGAILWSSSYFNGEVHIDKSFRYVGNQDRSTPDADRTYYVWEHKDGRVIFIVDTLVNGSWTFPDDYDVTLTKHQNPLDKNILEHSPQHYTIWKGLWINSYNVLTKDLRMKIPKCKAVMQMGRISPSGKSAFVVSLVEPTKCNHSDFNTIKYRWDEFISVKK